MKCYELLFVVKPTLTDEEVKAQLDFMKNVLEKNGSQIESVKDMGVRKLAYEIEKHERGHYFVIYYKTETSAIEEILRNLRLSETIIRFLNLKFENKKEVAQWEKLAKAPVKSDKKPAPARAVEVPKEEEKSE
jgi:small subunit ribosomal protein S6